MNKKGAIVEDLMDFLFLVFAAFFSLVFIGLALGQVEDQNAMATYENAQQKEASALLNVFLTSPVIVDGEPMIMRDLVILWSENKVVYKDKMETEVSRIINSFAHSSSSVNLESDTKTEILLEVFTHDPRQPNLPNNYKKWFGIGSISYAGKRCENTLDCKFQGTYSLTTPSGELFLGMSLIAYGKVNT